MPGVADESALPAINSPMKRVLLVDPSARGGIATHTDLTAEVLAEAGLPAELVASSLLPDGGEAYPIWRWLPATDWARGRSDRSTATGRIAVGRRYARRLVEWTRAAAATTLAVHARRPSLVDFQAPLNPHLDARLVERLSRRQPVVWTAHDARPLEDSGSAAGRLVAIYRAADLVIAHSDYAAGRIEEASGVRPQVLGLLGPRGLERTERTEARRRLGLPESERILGALGFIRAYKGYELLAETWELLGDRAPLLLIVGELVDEGEGRHIDRLRAGGRAEVRLGFASADDLRLAYCAADAVVLPHLRASDSGLLDMARELGTPVIASDAPALARALEGDEGLVLPREAQRWAEAAAGALPGPPAPPPEKRPGDARRAVYERALESWRERHGRPSARPAPRTVVAYTDATETGGAELGLATLLAGLSERHRVTVMASDEAVGRWICSRRADARLELVPPVANKWDLRPILAHMRAIAASRRTSSTPTCGSRGRPVRDRGRVWARTGAVIAVEQLFTPTTSALQRRLSSRLGLEASRGRRATGREIEGEVGLPRGASARSTTRSPSGRSRPTRVPPPGRSWAPSPGSPPRRAST